MDDIHTTQIEGLPQMMWLSTLEDLDNPEDNLHLDEVVGEQVARGQRPATLRLWRHANTRGLVVSRKDVVGEGGTTAMEKMKDMGWPIFVRRTGGTAVPHQIGVLNFSLILPRTTSSGSTDLYYRLLCAPLVRWFEELGLKAATGPVPGSYCDGNYNVIVDGQKLVGTAQSWKGGLAGTASRHPGYILAHACMMIDVDLSESLAAINHFYHLVGNDYRVDASTSTTIGDLRAARGSARMSSSDAMVQFEDFLVRYYTARGIELKRVPN